MSRHLLLLLALLTFGGCDDSRAPQLTASDGWVREPLPGRDMTAAYVRLSNNGDSELVINRVTSAQYGRIEIHTTTLTDGSMQMRAIESLRIAPGSTLTLQPGGTHLMLMAPTGTLATTGRIELTLYSDSRPLAELSLPVSGSNPHE